MLKGKVAVVTGGTRGIGFETVRQFLLNGAKVALCGSREETVVKAVDKLKTENAAFEVEGFFPNLSKEAEVAQMMADVKAKYGKIDILVNNAGISSSTPLLNYTEDEFDKISNLNIKSVFAGRHSYVYATSGSRSFSLCWADFSRFPSGLRCARTGGAISVLS